MLKGINLTLLIGPGIAVPAPKILMESLKDIQVTNSKDRSGFQLTFAIGKTSPILTTLLAAGFFDPIVTRVIIIATLNGIPNVLMDGLITNQELAPSNEAGKSTLTVTGEDLSLAMDLVEMIVPFTAMPEVAAIYLTLAPYAALGIVPIVIPPVISPIPIPTSYWESQVKVTHRALLKGLAARVGYIFVVQPGPLPGQSVAYFGPDINLPIPQPALSINLDGHTNVESLSFSLDGKAKKIKIFTIYDPITRKIPILVPVPNINFLKPPLGLRPTPPAKIEFEGEGANKSPLTAAQKILGYMMNNSTAITANGSLDVLRYNGILRARMLVGVRGSGLAYDGMYYVDSVTHNIKKGEYKQNFTLSRDGLISNTPLVLV